MRKLDPDTADVLLMGWVMALVTGVLAFWVYMTIITTPQLVCH